MSSDSAQLPRIESHPEESPADSTAPGATTSEGPSPRVQGPEGPASPEGTSSVDDLSLSLGKVSPDPYLDDFPAEVPTVATAPIPDSQADVPGQPGSWTALDVPVGPETHGADGPHPDVPAVIAGLVLDPKAEGTPKREDGSGPGEVPEPFAGLDLSAPPAKAATASARPDAKDGAETDEDEYEDVAPRGSGWAMTLLFSYASAVTLGLLWVLWGHRIPREREGVEADPFPAAETSADPGHRAGQSRKITPPPPLPADHVAALGQTVRLGMLEVTPLDVAAGRVTLVREVGGDETKPGGEGALSLRLRLRNVSTDSILVPLDEAFLRERRRATRDSFLETGSTTQVDMFPLAVESEWSIVGQEFRELRPDESYETKVYTAPDALGRLAPEMTWRVRLRTDINQTETLGVRIREDEIRGLPARK